MYDGIEVLAEFAHEPIQPGFICNHDPLLATDWRWRWPWLLPIL
jgi:hypothetical protein